MFPKEVMMGGGELNEAVAQKGEVGERGGADIGVLSGSTDPEYVLEA